MLDGFPRTIEQANALQEICKELDRPLDAVINIDVDPKVLVDRLSGRFICKNCGATYHKLYKMPKVENTCDICGGHEFYQRSDDKPETVKNRLDVNIKMNTPLIDFYKNVIYYSLLMVVKILMMLLKTLTKYLSNSSNCFCG